MDGWSTGLPAAAVALCCRVGSHRGGWMALRCVAAAAGPDAASVATVVAAETGRLLARAGPGRAGPATDPL